MTVGLDGIIFTLQRHGGISVYFRELLARLARDRQDVRLYVDGPSRQDLPQGLPIVQRGARLAERYRRMRGSSSDAIELVHSSYYRSPDDAAIPSVVTVYDFVYERHVGGLAARVHSIQKFAAIRKARALIFISQATLDECRRFVGIRDDQVARVVHLGASQAYRPLALPESRDPPFVLFVGQRGGYKNFATLLRAIARVPELHLHCAGGGPLREDELREVEPPVRARVRHLGHPTDEALNELYNRALCLAYPSRCEGFGVPVVEAMAAGCPVVSTHCEAVLETGGDALAVADDDSRAFADTLRGLLEPGRRSRHVQRGFEVAARFSWERCYQETLQVYSAARGSDA